MSSGKNFGDPTTFTTVYVCVVGVLIFVLTVIYLEAVFYKVEEANRMDKVVNQPSTMLEKNRDAQNAVLNSYTYEHSYNDNAGRITIPIDEAVQKLLMEWQLNANNVEDSSEDETHVASADNVNNNGDSPD